MEKSAEVLHGDVDAHPRRSGGMSNHRIYARLRSGTPHVGYRCRRGMRRSRILLEAKKRVNFKVLPRGGHWDVIPSTENP